MEKASILLVEDHTIVREGLRALLSRYDSLSVVGEACDGVEAIERVEELHPDIVLMDIAMPRMNGIEATRIIHQRFPNSKVIILTQYGDKYYVRSLLKAGASGYILKDALRDDLIRAIKIVLAGDSFIHSAVSGELVRMVHDPVVSLSPREQEILELIVQGHKNTELAEMLSLSVKTVDWHRTNIMRKLGVHNLAELIRYAYDHGLVVA